MVLAYLLGHRGHVVVRDELIRQAWGGEAWPGRVRHPFGEVEVDFIGREAFLRNKRAIGRAKDLGDIEGME